MLGLLKRVPNKTVLLQTAKWLSECGEGMAAKKIISELLRDDPKDMAARALYAQTQTAWQLTKESVEKPVEASRANKPGEMH